MEQNRQINIVLAEDEDIIAMAYQKGLSYAGFNVTLVKDGIEALKAISMGLYDILLLDIVMPKMTGFDLLKVIKNNPKLEKRPVIILTNLGQTTDELKAKELGATDFIIKSDVSLKELVKRINKALEI